MNKISFIIEFDEVSKTQEEQLTKFIEKTGIKFHVLENDNDLKKYEKYKEVIDKAVKYIDDLRDESAERQGFYNCFPDDLYIPDINELLDILKEVSECNK